MRIRSNLTARNLYSERRIGDASGTPGGGRRTPPERPRSPAGRQLFRLILLLVLVLMLMQQAADPDIYRRFFQAVGTPLDDAPPAVESRKNDPRPQRAEAAGQTQPAVATGRGATVDATPLSATVAALDADARGELSRLLATRRRAAEVGQGGAPDELRALEGVRVSDELLEEVARAAAAGGEADPESLVAAIKSLQPGNSSEPASSGESSASAAASNSVDADVEVDIYLWRLQAALDDSYWTTVSDATVWQPGDANAFYRLLEIDGQSDERPIRVGYAALADQPRVYRGRRVSLEGTVARIEFERAAENLFGIEDYWLVWLRPADGSERPVMVYAAELPTDLRQLASTGAAADATVVDGPRVIADGTFMRRHLYPSRRGSELAPVVVGTIHLDEPELARGVGEVPPDESPGRLLLGGVVAAIVLAVGFTLWAAWHTGRSGRWRREVRSRGAASPVPFLESLDGPRRKGEGSDE